MGRRGKEKTGEAPAHCHSFLFPALQQIVASVAEELARRGGLDAAIGGRGPDSLPPLLDHLRRHIAGGCMCFGGDVCLGGGGGEGGGRDWGWGWHVHVHVHVLDRLCWRPCSPHVLDPSHVLRRLCEEGVREGGSSNLADICFPTPVPIILPSSLVPPPDPSRPSLLSGAGIPGPPGAGRLWRGGGAKR